MKMNIVLTIVYIYMIWVFISSVSSLVQERKVYIAYMGSLLVGEYSPSLHHSQIIKQIVDPSFSSKSLIRSYERSFNGFSAYLSEEEKEKLTRMPGVVSVFPCQRSQLQTTRSWDFMGLSRSIERRPAIESDIIIGVIDSGIWLESESFSDEGFGPIPVKWKGACDGGKDFVCNKKIIGARSFSVESNELSARDTNGHGTHVASILAGNEVRDTNYYGLAYGIARGGVPSARLAIYKACDSGCHDTDILSAFEHAIADGVDIISISLGHEYQVELTFDPIAIGAFHATERGILTVNAAGNGGDSISSINSYAPWIFSVGASDIDRRIVGKLLLEKEAILAGNAINAFPSSDGASPLVYGKEMTSSCSDADARDLEIQIIKSVPIDNPGVHFVASFSARGPSIFMPDIIKPDVIAPGVEILAAFSPIASPSGVTWDKNFVKFNIISGTSMACPHVAATAAFVKSFHQDWSPSAIKSALMTTAWEFSSLYPEAEFAYGSGHIDPLNAINPGLVYETSMEEYIRIWCNISQTPGSVIPTTASCPMKVTPKDINYPSMAAQVYVKDAFVVSFPRTLTNVGRANSTYVASIEGDPSMLRFIVEPNTLKFTTLNEKMNFVVTVRGERMKPLTIRHVSLMWTDGVHRVRSPILIHTMGTSDKEIVLSPSKFHLTFVILVIVILLY